MIDAWPLRSKVLDGESKEGWAEMEQAEKMMALNLHGVGDLRYEAVPRPVPQADEVLLQVKAVGICGSDIPRVFTKGTYHFPTVIGHEFSRTAWRAR